MHSLINDWKLVCTKNKIFFLLLVTKNIQILQVSGLDIADTKVTIYMLALKGHIGFPLLLDENGTQPFFLSHGTLSLPAGIYNNNNNSSSSTTTTSTTNSTCFIANRLRDWYYDI